MMLRYFGTTIQRSGFFFGICAIVVGEVSNTHAFAQAVQSPAPAKKGTGATPSAQPSSQPAAKPSATRSGSSSTSQAPEISPFDTDDGEAHIGTGLSAVFGLDLGGAASFSARERIESNKTGQTFVGKALLTLYVEKMMIEAGPGWFFNRMNGKRAPDLRADGDSDATEVSTGAGLFEFSARYRATERLQLGPVGQVLFGSDASFSPFESQTKKSAVFLGLGLVSGDPSKMMDFRYGVQILGDVNVSDRQVYLLNLNLQFGVPLIKPDVVIKEKQVVRYKEKQVEKIVNRFIYVLDSEVLNFETNKAELLPESRIFVLEIGRFLAENYQIWEGLDIAGHTDSRGVAERNKELSRDRADEVKAVLLTAGITAEKIRTYGFGSERPINTATDDVSLAQNRRVELSFEGIKNVQLLRNEIDRIRKTAQKPKTCGADGCK